MKFTHLKQSLLIMGFWLLAVHAVSAAALYLENFAGGLNGWGSRDGEMIVSDGGGYAAGNFSSQPFSIPQTDAFDISSGTDFLGNYTVAGLTQISFQLNAVNVLPSDLFIRIIDGANTFSYQFNPLLTASFETYTVNLDWTFGWIGLSEAAFNTALTSVDSLQIQITRNGTSAQDYYLDNIQTLDTDIGDQGGMSSIPEPSTFSLFVLSAFVISGFRRRLNRMSLSR